MKQSTPNLVSPEQAIQIWADLLPGPPETVAALLSRTRRRTGPPGTLVRHTVRGRGFPGTQTMYDPAKVREWCLGQQPAAVQAAIAALEAGESSAPAQARALDDYHEDLGLVLWVTGPDEDFDHYLGNPLCSDWPVDDDGEPVFRWWVPFPQYHFPQDGGDL